MVRLAAVYCSMASVRVGRSRAARFGRRRSRSLTLWTLVGALDCSAGGGQDVYFEKIRVFQAGVSRPNNGAWNNGIGPRFYFVGFRN